MVFSGHLSPAVQGSFHFPWAGWGSFISAYLHIQATPEERGRERL